MSSAWRARFGPFCSVPLSPCFSYQYIRVHDSHSLDWRACARVCVRVVCGVTFLLLSVVVSAVWRCGVWRGRKGAEMPYSE